jgi:ankyrin repeat protein
VASSFDKRALDQLTTAIIQGDTEKALSLVKPELPLDTVVKGHHLSPLFAAIEIGNIPVVEALIAAGASVTATNEMGETPLHAAAGTGPEALIRALLARGASWSWRVASPSPGGSASGGTRAKYNFQLPTSNCQGAARRRRRLAVNSKLSISNSQLPNRSAWALGVGSLRLEVERFGSWKLAVGS